MSRNLDSGRTRRPHRESARQLATALHLNRHDEAQMQVANAALPRPGRTQPRQYRRRCGGGRRALTQRSASGLLPQTCVGEPSHCMITDNGRYVAPIFVDPARFEFTNRAAAACQWPAVDPISRTALP